MTTTVEQLEMLLKIARHVAEKGAPEEAARAAKRVRTYEWALDMMRSLAS